jgi:predicted amidohydrolase YtcJ
MWLINARIWDGTSESYLAEDAIQIEGGKVLSLGKSGDATG